MKRFILTSYLCVLFAAGTALADWNIGDPAKWAQLPDLGFTGIDIYNNSPQTLADDFLCTTTGYITDLHFWGSWLNDYLPHPAAGADLGDPAAVAFNLYIYSDIPDTDGDGPDYSNPGQLLWSANIPAGGFSVRKYADANEGWYNPMTGDYMRANHSGVWQYNFVAPPDANLNDLFYQQGTPKDPIVYWVGVQAIPQDQQAVFGWKTSIDHWNDDAVWQDAAGSWLELRYPQDHPYAGQSIDLAFVVTPEPATIVLLGLGGLLLKKK
jgi:hypothetical protein